jgi:LacI family transcriptional regulator
MAITLDQVAKLAGVSRTTVSRVMNGHPGVRLLTRERVLKIIRELGYQPNPEARSLAAQRSRKEP